MFRKRDLLLAIFGGKLKVYTTKRRPIFSDLLVDPSEYARVRRNHKVALQTEMRRNS